MFHGSRYPWGSNLARAFIDNFFSEGINDKRVIKLLRKKVSVIEKERNEQTGLLTREIMCTSIMM